MTGAFLSYVLIAIFTPGPNNILSLATASNYGFKIALKLLVGISVGFFVIMLLSSYFNLFLMASIPQFETVLNILGAGFMVYLAYKIFKSRPHQTHKDTDQLPGHLFKTGLLMQFINPKGILFALTVTGNFILPLTRLPMALMAYSLFLAFLAFCSVVLWASFGQLFNRFLRTYYQPVNTLMALLLCYSALAILGLL